MKRLTLSGALTVLTMLALSSTWTACASEEPAPTEQTSESTLVESNETTTLAEEESTGTGDPSQQPSSDGTYATTAQSSCASCGPLPDPWRKAGPLPDPWTSSGGTTTSGGTPTGTHK